MKTELKCEYCGMEIGENDKKCSSCGANCANVTSKYRKEKEAILNEKKKQVVQGAKKAMIIGSIPAIIIFTLVIGLFIFIIYMGVSSMKDTDKSYTSPDYDNKLFDFGKDTNKEESVEVSYNEKANTGKYEVTLVSYDLYAYDSKFKSERTKDGYQRIAFEFDIKNLTSDRIHSMNITLKADGYNVEEANLEEHFGTLKQGSGNYPELKIYWLDGNDEQKGYIGFEVPKNRKELEFKVGKYVTIKMDNPAYSG